MMLAMAKGDIIQYSTSWWIVLFVILHYHVGIDSEQMMGCGCTTTGTVTRCVGVDRIPIDYFNQTDAAKTKTLFLNCLNRFVIAPLSRDHLPNLPTLEHIEIKGCGVTSILSHAFQNVNNVDSIRITENDLQNLDQNAFRKIGQGLKLITTLTLSNNQLVEIPQYAFIDLSTVHHINLRDNKLRHVAENAFLSLRVLHTLDIGENNLVEIPDLLLQTLDSLVKLDLDNNNLGAVNGLNMPSNNKLVEVNLQYNSISTVTQICGNMHLIERMFLTNNKLEHLNASTFTTCPKLERLNLDFNKITSINDDTFSKMPALVYLDLSNNLLRSVNSQIFKSLTNITFLYLQNNQILSLHGMPFVNNVALRYLDLSHNKIAVLGSAVFSGLKLMETLHLASNSLTKIQYGTFSPKMFAVSGFLNISNNALIEIENKSFANLKLIVLDLSGNNRLKACPKDILLASNIIEMRFSFTSLDLSTPENNIFHGIITPNERVVHLSNHIGELNIHPSIFRNISFTLGHLQLRDNKMGDFEFLNHIKGVTTLDLENSDISDVLSKWRVNKTNPAYHQSIRNLYLSNTGLKHFHLAEKLIGSQLEYLDLSLNSFDDISISLPKLKDLKLQYNKLPNSLNISLELSNVNTLDFEGTRLISYQAIASQNNIYNLNLGSSNRSDIDSFNVPVTEFRCAHANLTSLKLVVGSSVHILILNHNSIRRIDMSDLSGHTDLRHVDLSHNMISVIHPAALEGLEYLEYFNLSHNYINVMPFNYFPLRELQNLHYLDMSFNLIQSWEDIEVHDRGSNLLIYLHDNPLHCNCESQWMANLTCTRLPAGLLNNLIGECKTPRVQNFNSYLPSDFPCIRPVITQVAQTYLPSLGCLAICEAEGDPSPVVALYMKESQQITKLISSTEPPVQKSLTTNRISHLRDISDDSVTMQCRATSLDITVQKEFIFLCNDTDEVMTTEQTGDVMNTGSSDTSYAAWQMALAIILTILFTALIVIGILLLYKYIRSKRNKKNTEEIMDGNTTKINTTVGNVDKIESSNSALVIPELPAKRKLSVIEYMRLKVGKSKRGTLKSSTDSEVKREKGENGPQRPAKTTMRGSQCLGEGIYELTDDVNMDKEDEEIYEFFDEIEPNKLSTYDPLSVPNISPALPPRQARNVYGNASDEPPPPPLSKPPDQPAGPQSEDGESDGEPAKPLRDLQPVVYGNQDTETPPGPPLSVPPVQHGTSLGDELYANDDDIYEDAYTLPRDNYVVISTTLSKDSDL